jgi:hypothetical protein
LNNALTEWRREKAQRRSIEYLPPSDGNPFTLTRAVAGVALGDDLSLRFSRTFDHYLASTPGVTKEDLSASS